MESQEDKLAFILSIIRKSACPCAKLYLDSQAWEDCKSFMDRDVTRVFFGGLEVVLDNRTIYAEVKP